MDGGLISKTNTLNMCSLGWSQDLTIQTNVLHIFWPIDWPLHSMQTLLLKNPYISVLILQVKYIFIPSYILFLSFILVFMMSCFTVGLSYKKVSLGIILMAKGKCFIFSFTPPLPFEDVWEGWQTFYSFPLHLLVPYAFVLDVKQFIVISIMLM